MRIGALARSGWQTSLALALSALFVVVAASPSTATTLPQPLEDVFTPTVVGEPRVGVPLTAVSEVWRPALVTMRYQWYAGTSAISGATSSTYVPTTGVVGKTITVKLTGSKTGYLSASRTSEPTAPVLSQQPFEIVPAPLIDGVAKVGMRLTVTTEGWVPAPAKLSFTWYSGSSVITGATQRTLVVPSSAAGQRVSVRVTASAPGYVNTSTRSASTPLVAKASVMPVFSKPTLSGSARVGYPLRANPGNWGPEQTTFRYQWYVGTTKIAGATGQTYTPSASLQGRRVTVKVTGSRPGYISKTVTSSASAVIGARSTTPSVQVYSAEPIGRGVQVAWEPSSVVGINDSYLVTAWPTAGYVNPACPSPQPVAIVEPSSSTGSSISGLCTGVVYTATVAAVVAGRTGPPGRASAPVVPLDAQVPDAPLIVEGIPRSGSVTLSWVAPSYDGGEQITGYRINTYVDGVEQPQSSYSETSPLTIDGLVDGREYEFALIAENAVGSSQPSRALFTPTPPYEPGQPQNITGGPDGSGNVVLSWAPPRDDGGSNLTGYLVTYQQVEQSPDASWSVVEGAPEHSVSLPSTSTAAIVSEFDEPSGFYAFTVSAINAIGESEPGDVESPVSPTVAVRSNVIVLDGASLDAISSVSATSITWLKPLPPQLMALASGDVIVADISPRFPEGLLRRVLSVTSPTGRLVAATGAADLTDVLDSGSIASDLDTLAGQPEIGSALPAGAEFRPTMAGVELVRPTYASEVSLSTSLTFAVAFKGETGTGCKLRAGSCVKYDIKASINVKPSISLGLNITQNMVGIPDGVALTATAKVTATTSLTATISASQKWQIGEIVGAPVTIPIGPVPVVAVPRVPVFLTVSGSASLGMTATVTIGASVTWSSKDPGNLTTTNLSTPPILGGGVIPGLSATGKASVAIGILPTVALFGVGGPSVEGSISITADMNFNPRPGEAFLTFSPKLEVKAGVSLTMFGNASSLQFTVAVISLPPLKIYEVPNPPYILRAASPSASVGVPVTFTATRADGNIQALTWRVKGGVAGDSITASGVFTAASPSGRTVTIAVSDSSGSTGETTLTVGAPYTSPRNVTIVPAPTGAGVTVSWTAPASTGGFAVSGYRVTTSTTSTVVSTTARSVVLSGLPAGTTVVTVRAINLKGIASPSATATVQIGIGGGIAGRTVAEPGAVQLSLPEGSYGDLTLADVACGAPGSCVAIGSSRSNYTIIQTLTDGVWTAMNVPTPADQSPGTIAQVYEVACDAPGSCVAVGNYVSTTQGTVALILRLKDGVWTPTAMPSISGAGVAQGTLWSVDCRDRRECVAVGGGSGPLIAHMVDDVWTAVEPALPPLNDTQRDAALTSVTCGKGGTCAAIGLYPVLGTSGAHYFAMLDEGRWTTQRSPAPIDVLAGPVATHEIDGVACGDGVCIAGGTYLTKFGTWRPLVQAFSNGSWSATRAPTPTDASTVNLFDGTGSPIKPAVSSVACPTDYECVALGWYGVTSAKWRTVAYKYSSGAVSYTVPQVPLRTSPVKQVWGSAPMGCNDSGDCIVPMGEFSAVYAGGQWGLSPQLGGSSLRPVTCVGENTCLTTRGGMVYTFELR